jgi:rhodanese-related sulfurtransferase
MRASLRLISVAVVACLFASCGHKEPPKPPAKKPAATKPAAPKQGRVTTMDLNTLLFLQQNNRALIYDARAAVIHAYSHVPGSVSWPRTAYNDQLVTREAEIRAAIAAGKNVVIYCTDTACPDARAVANQLAARGHAISVLEGGFHAWKDAGLPVE